MNINEHTQRNILKEHNQTEQTKQTLEAIKKMKEPKEPKETQETTELKTLKENQIRLGKNKTVTIKPWTGKTKKKIKKIFEGIESPEDIDFVKVIKILIYEYINEEVYLNEGEQQFLLLKIREISLGKEIQNTSDCSNCGEENYITCNTDEVVHYKENELPKIISETLELIDIPSLKFLEDGFKEYAESNNYDGVTTFADYESALHIKIKNKSISEVIDF